MRSIVNGNLLVVVALFALLATAPALGNAKSPMKLSANMSAAQVVPNKPKGNVAQAKGTLAATLTSSGSRWKLAWRITYNRLDHPALVIADIHYGKPGQFGPIVVRLCGPCRSGQQGTVNVNASRIPAITSGDTFMTLITGKNPNGEIRGQIKVR